MIQGGHEQEANMRQKLTTMHSGDHNKMIIKSAGRARDRSLAEMLCQRRESVDLLTNGTTMQWLHRGIFYKHNFLKGGNMKKILSSMAIIGYTILNVAAANAADGTITFKGLLVDTSCEVSVNGQGANAIVTLPTVAVTALSTAGATAGETSFDITLSACDGSATKVVAEFENSIGTNIDAASGHLINLDTGMTGALNVQLQVLDRMTGSPIKLGDPSQLGATPAMINGGVATLPYTVRYYATDQAEAGGVTSIVAFTIIYP